MKPRDLALAGASALALGSVAGAQGLMDESVTGESAASAMDAPTGDATHYGGGLYEECVTITFEGGEQAAPIGASFGAGTAFPLPWRTLNSGPFSKSPSQKVL